MTQCFHYLHVEHFRRSAALNIGTPVTWLTIVHCVLHLYLVWPTSPNPSPLICVPLPLLTSNLLSDGMWLRGGQPRGPPPPLYVPLSASVAPTQHSMPTQPSDPRIPIQTCQYLLVLNSHTQGLREETAEEREEAGRGRWNTRANIFRGYQARAGPLGTSELIRRADPLLQLSSVLYKPVLAGPAQLPALRPSRCARRNG